MRGRGWRALLFLLASVACGPSRLDPSSSAPRRSSALVSDQVHSGGTPGFFFLPPLLPATAYGEFVPGLAPVVWLPDGRVVEYVVDGLDRRVGKKVNGALVEGFLYDGQLRPVAWLDGSEAGSCRCWRPRAR